MSPAEAGKQNWRTTFWQTLTRFDASKVEPWLALRNSIGIALPLATGAAMGAIGPAVVVSTGALNVAFSDSSEPYPVRARRMLAASIFVSLAVFAGSLCGGSNVLFIVVAATWAFASGMLVALDSAAADVGTISLVTLIVYAAQPMEAGRAFSASLLALGGGLFQMLLSLALWPVRRYEPERRALAGLYREMARVAAAYPVSASVAPAASAESTNAQRALANLRSTHTIEGERYRSLLNQAERMRISMLMLARLRIRIQRETSGVPCVAILERFFAIAAKLLDSIAVWLVSGQPPEGTRDCVEELENLAERLRGRDQEQTSEQSAMLLDARAQMDALAGQLRAALDLTSHATPSGTAEFGRRESRKPWSLRLGGTAATLRANLNLESAACRHAIRLSFCVALAAAIGREFDLRRSYWVPMTVAILLKPDFTATFTRGVLRLAGTFVGLLLATGMFHGLPESRATEVTSIAVLAFVLRCFGPANYGIFVVPLTAFVVFEFAIIGVDPKQVMAARALNTCLGGFIALAAYWAWPTWERSKVAEAIARLLDSYRAYFRAIRDSYVYPDRSFTAELDRARLAGRLARSNVEASVDRLLHEPGTAQETVEAVSALLASTHRLIHAMMALEAGLTSSQPVPARPSFRVFADQVELTMYYLSSALRGSRISAADLPDLREVHHALTHSGDRGKERYALVNVETDRITNSLNTVSEKILALLGNAPKTEALPAVPDRS